MGINQQISQPMQMNTSLNNSKMEDDESQKLERHDSFSVGFDKFTEL